VKEFLKLVHIWRRYGQKYGDMFFLTHGVVLVLVFVLVLVLVVQQAATYSIAAVAGN